MINMDIMYFIIKSFIEGIVIGLEWAAMMAVIIGAIVAFLDITITIDKIKDKHKNKKQT